MKGLLVCLFITVGLAVRDRLAQATNVNDLLTFHNHYNLYFRRHFGCPSEAKTTEDCRPENGFVDAAEFKAAREAAKKLFDLTDKR